VARARWYELDTSGAAPTLVQTGQIDPGPGLHTYLPSIDIAPNGDLGMTYVQSSAATADFNSDGFADGYLSMYVTGRKATDPLGTMQPPVLVKAGEATYTFSVADPPPYRVGDYGGLVVDPVNGTFWAGNEYATHAVPPPNYSRPFGNWGTWIANFSIGDDGPSALLADIVAADLTMTMGDVSVDDVDVADAVTTANPNQRLPWNATVGIVQSEAVVKDDNTSSRTGDGKSRYTRPLDQVFALYANGCLEEPSESLLPVCP
jgi:hypothetical protein